MVALERNTPAGGGSAEDKLRVAKLTVDVYEHQPDTLMMFEGLRWIGLTAADLRPDVWSLSEAAAAAAAVKAAKLYVDELNDALKAARAAKPVNELECAKLEDAVAIAQDAVPTSHRYDLRASAIAAVAIAHIVTGETEAYQSEAAAHLAAVWGTAGETLTDALQVARTAFTLAQVGGKDAQGIADVVSALATDANFRRRTAAAAAKLNAVESEAAGQ